MRPLQEGAQNQSQGGRRRSDLMRSHRCRERWADGGGAADGSVPARLQRRNPICVWTSPQSSGKKCLNQADDV